MIETFQCRQGEYSRLYRDLKKNGWIFCGCRLINEWWVVRAARIGTAMRDEDFTSFMNLHAFRPIHFPSIYERG